MNKVYIDYDKLMAEVYKKGISREMFASGLAYSESWLGSVKKRGWIHEDDRDNIWKKFKINPDDYEIRPMTPKEAAQILQWIWEDHYRNTLSRYEEGLIYAINYLRREEKNVGEA